MVSHDPVQTVVVKLKKAKDLVDVLIDAEDKHYVDNYTMWVNTQGYVQIYYKGKIREFSRLLLGILDEPSSTRADHIDHNPLNDSKSNLRVVNCGENAQNREKKKNCSSSYKGVVWNKHKQLWSVAASHDGVRSHLGFFAKDDELEAGKMYDRYITFKYQPKTMCTNNLLTPTEIEDAKRKDPTPAKQKSKHGLGVQKSRNKFRCVWQDNGVTHQSKGFATAKEASGFREQKLRDVKLRNRQLMFARGIKYNADGIPIITTNTVCGTQHDVKVNESIYFKLARYNWGFNECTKQITCQRDCIKISLAEMVLSLFKRVRNEGDTVDHLYHEHDDCRIESLRWASKAEQAQNRRKRKGLTSQYLGVSFITKRQKWKAQVFISGKSKYCSFFESEEDAKNARDTEIVKYYKHPVTNAKPELRHIEEIYYHHSSDESSEDDAINDFLQRTA